MAGVQILRLPAQQWRRRVSRLVPFEVLHGALMLFGGSARLEGAEVATLPGLGIDLTRVEPVLAG